MKHPARTLRALIEDLPEAQPFLEKRDRLRHALIRAAGIRCFARLGPDTFSVHDFLKARWMSVPTFNTYYVDLESLLFDLLHNHLLDLANALGGLPPGAHAAAARAAYLKATRNPGGGLTEIHILLAHH